jgi:hypothetical protein
MARLYKSLSRKTKRFRKKIKIAKKEKNILTNKPQPLALRIRNAYFQPCAYLPYHYTTQALVIL